MDAELLQIVVRWFSTCGMDEEFGGDLFARFVVGDHT